jgi:C-terminal processing protease CtpA/Prc
MKENGLPVAVLTSNNTASSGEAVFVACRGRPSTRSFGNQTAGFSTSNRTFEMSDRAWIVLTGSTYADRNGQLYGREIQPDGKTEILEEVPLKARAWLLAQPTCKNEE